MKVKLAKVIAPDLEEYTSIELAYLLQDLIKEIRDRQKGAPKIINELNQKTYDYTHEIELSEPKTRKEKADYYEDMQEHFKDRRLAKNEHIIVEDIFNEMGLNMNKVLQVLGRELKSKNQYFQLESGKRVVKPSVWKSFYERCLKPYM